MLSVCCVTDDKPGHKSQLDGLLAALKRHRPVREQWFHLGAPGMIEPPLDLVLCVGRRTHLPAIKLKRQCGGKVVALSKSWVPRWAFDLNILPAHDRVPESEKVFTTIGSMNAILPSSDQDSRRGLILIGGPSANHGWNSEDLVDQIRRLLLSFQDVRWTLTTSRRTPAEFESELRKLGAENLQFVPMAETSRDWLLGQYRECGLIWVTEDSVSMVCESLSSGAQVGALSVPRKKTGRVASNLDDMVASGRVLTLSVVEQNGAPEAVEFPPLQEAERSAIRLLNWLDKQTSGSNS